MLNSCSGLRAAIYLVSIEDDENNVLENEPYVRSFMETIIELYEDYTFKAYARTGIRAQFRRTRLMTHSYYAIINNKTCEYNTLSYYGTKIAFRSRGAWALDSNADRSSYILYLEDNNIWDVQEIFKEFRINVKKTAENIIKKMDSGVTYYFRDHIRDKPNVDNCNTALYETIVTEPRSTL